MPPKPETSKYSANKYVFTAELERANTNTSNPLHNAPHLSLNKKERIPHSAYYMHKIHKRVSTANNESQHISRENVVEELKNFTKKMVGKEPSRLSSEHR